jgi:sec-independent protein translocase protein TatA
MGFLDIGTGEILLILILALILLGPGKIPEIARTLGRTIRAVKKASADLTTAVTRELEVKENEPRPSPPKEAKTQPAPPDTGQAATLNQDDKPAKPGEASATK